MPHQNDSDFQTLAHKRVADLYDELSVREHDRERLNRVITGHGQLEQMKVEDLRLLTALLTELTSRPREEQVVTLDVLLAVAAQNENSSE